jgi:hypothetical protein
VRADEEIHAQTRSEPTDGVVAVPFGTCTQCQPVCPDATNRAAILRAAAGVLLAVLLVVLPGAPEYSGQYVDQVDAHQTAAGTRRYVSQRGLRPAEKSIATSMVRCFRVAQF